MDFVFLKMMIDYLALSTLWSPGILQHLAESDIKLKEHKGEKVYCLRSSIVS